MGDEAVKMVDEARAKVSEYTILHSMVGEQFFILRDAATAIDAGAPLSGTVAIRSGIESAGFYSLTRERVGDGFRVVRPEVRDMSLWQIERELDDGELLPPNLQEAFGRIREHGNDVAHLTSRTDTKVEKRARENLAAMREGREQTGGFITHTPFPEEVLTDLREGIAIAVALAERMAAET